MARSAPMGGKGGGQSVPYQPAGFGQNQQFSGGFGMGPGGFSQPQFGQPPQFGGGFGRGFGMQQQPPFMPNARPPGPGYAGFRGGQLGTTQPEAQPATLPSLNQAKDFLGPDIMRELQRRSRPVSARDGFGGAEAGRINDMRYRAPGRVLPPGRFQPFPQPQPQPNYNQLPQPMPAPRPQPYQPMPMPGYGGFPGGYMPLPRPQPMPRYQPALPSRLGSPTMYQGRGFTPNYGVPRSMIQASGFGGMPSGLGSFFQ
jgi:far upstream element-binding protein|tara:strand:- start:3141 stop:3908 length:768 start_codon:yes stop_codon:yes gene_type:complete